MTTILKNHPLKAIIVLAIIARVAVLFMFPSVFAFEQTGTIHGSEAYDEYALNLLETGIYGRTPGVPDAAIPPLYSYALAVVYGIFGRGYLQVGLFHTLLDVLSIAILYEIARRVFPQYGRAVGLLAGLFYALYPYLIFQNLTLIDTPFFITILHAFVLLVVVLWEQENMSPQDWLVAVGAGIVLGLSMLARPITPPLALLVALWFLFKHSFIETVRRLLPVAMISAAILIPWIIRNYHIYDAFVTMTTTSGSNFWQGNSEWTIPVFRAGYDVQWTAPDIEGPRNTREADVERFALALDFLRNNPEKIPELIWVKLLVHWSIDIAPRYNPQPGEQLILNEDGELEVVRTGETIPGVTDANASYDEPLFDIIGRWIHRFYYGTLFLLALLGIVVSWRFWRAVAILWFVQISMTLVYLIFHPATRYRVPTDPLLFTFSAYALIWLWKRRKARQQLIS